jgi:hypothetical protein
MLAAGFLAVTCAACAPGGGDGSYDSTEDSAAALTHEAPIAATLLDGNLKAKVIEIKSYTQLLTTVRTTDAAAYIHTADSGAWYFKSGNYLLGIESFVQFKKEITAWVTFDAGDNVAPEEARVVGHNYRGQGWTIPVIKNGGKWPMSANNVWVVGTDDGVLGMGGAPDGMPLGTKVFGSMQTYGSFPSTPYLVADTSPKKDSSRIRALFSFNADTHLGGHSAGSSSARRIAFDLGLDNVFLYGTPNYSRQDGEYTVNSTNWFTRKTTIIHVVNNPHDPVTDCLRFPIHLVSVAWGNGKCHDYTNWDYEATSSEEDVCN